MNEAICKADIKTDIKAIIKAIIDILVILPILVSVLYAIPMIPGRHRYNRPPVFYSNTYGGITTSGYINTNETYTVRYLENIFGREVCRAGDGRDGDDGKYHVIDDFITKEFVPVLLICIFASVLIYAIFKKFMSAPKKCRLALYPDKIEGVNIMFSEKKLNLPIDKVDSIMTYEGISDKLFFGGKSICIGTSSGRMRFRAVHNADDFVNEALRIIEENKKNDNSSTKQDTQSTVMFTADEMKKYKELFDQGVLTEEEFAAKKKQLLGL